jgi:hypothetical protein
MLHAYSKTFLACAIHQQSHRVVRARLGAVAGQSKMADKWLHIPLLEVGLLG